MGDELDKKLDKVLGELRDDLAKMPDEEPVVLWVAHERMLLGIENPDALWPDGLDDAFIGIARRCGQPALAAFSVKKCIEVFMKRDGMNYVDADEFFSFNVADAWMGPGTPVWIDDVEEE